MQYLVMRNEPFVGDGQARHMRMTRIWQPGPIVDFSDSSLATVPRGTACVGAQIDNGIKTGDGKVYGIFRGIDSKNYASNQNVRTLGSVGGSTSRFNMGRNQIDTPQTSLQNAYIHECIALYGDAITDDYVQKLCRALENKWKAAKSINKLDTIL
jgi:hypothetical protein